MTLSTHVLLCFPNVKRLPSNSNAFNYGRDHIYIYRVSSVTIDHIYKVKMLNDNENEVPQAILHMWHSWPII